MLPRVLVAAAILVLLAGAEPAGADPARPTDYRSEVTSVDPATEDIEIRVVGGDAFLQVEAEPGHEVVVLGYQDEPYVRIAPDGTVDRNLRSQATYINDDRYGGGAIPPDVDPDAEPRWETVDDDGEYTWHDHRIHWMSPERPPGHAPGDVISVSGLDDWTVPLAVDGSPVVVHGTLRWEEGTTPALWFGAAAAVAAALALAARGRTLAPIAAALAVAAAAAMVVGAAEYAAIPAGAGGSPVEVAVPAAALAAALVALWRRRHTSGAVAALASLALLAGWALLRIEVLLRPVLPTDLAPGLDRAGTVVALGVAVAAAVHAVRHLAAAQSARVSM
ncbi:MAG TPA: hypothetical protein VE575_05885 [Acidimicrobiales bacterium]|jgi:hypothetical protein|nr:hypothetical protein [Acidimicrobiales bacterium]